MNLDKLLDKSKTNYKVYTPKKIAREIVFKGLSLYFKGNKKKEKLDNLRAVDLACGDGNLLLELLEFLIRISKIYYGEYSYNENWVEGFDIDENALEIFNDRFNNLLKNYSLEGKLRLKCEDSLQLTINKKYNLILGNPPYLGEKNNREIFEKIKNTNFGKKYYEGKMDYLYFFIEKGIELLDENGILSYITTNYWLRADGAKKLRKLIKDELNFYYINNINRSVFVNALGQHNVIFTLTKSKINNFLLINEKIKGYVDNTEIYDNLGKITLLYGEDKEFCMKLKNKSEFLLKDKFNVNQGIVSGHDEAFVFDRYEDKFSRYLKPFFKNKDIHKYNFDEAQKYILYISKNVILDDEIINYLTKYKDKLEQRREVKKGSKKWWELQWARKEEIFIGPKIISRQRNRTNAFSIDFNEFYASADVYYITPKDKEINIYWILAYLNSKIFYRWFVNNGKNKGEFLELYSTPLKEVPIIYTNKREEIYYIENLVKKQINSYSPKIQNEIDDFFFSKL